MRAEVIRRAATIASAHGADIGEALRRWESAGGHDGGADASAWLSVAFLFARKQRLATGAAVVPTRH